MDAASLTRLRRRCYPCPRREKKRWRFTQRGRTFPSARRRAAAARAKARWSRSRATATSAASWSRRARRAINARRATSSACGRTKSTGRGTAPTRRRSSPKRTRRGSSATAPAPAPSPCSTTASTRKSAIPGRTVTSTTTPRRWRRNINSMRLRCALFLLLTLGGAAAADAQEPMRIRYGVTASIAHRPVVVGRDAGIFKKHGFDVEAIHIRGGALITATIMSGSVQFSGAGAESVVAARIEGGGVAMLARPVDQDAVYLVARPEIKSAAELKGKTTAVTRLGSATHFYLRAALNQVGLDEKDLTILQLGAGGEIAAAMLGGRVTAAALTIHNAYPFMQMGWRILADLAKSDFVYPSSCVASSRALIKSKGPMV